LGPSADQEFKVGDQVYGQALVLNGGSGAFAEFASSNVANTSLMPKNADFLESSALPLVGASAIQALEDYIKLTSGQKIVIHGGAGGIGHIAVQLAKHLGAYVASTISSNDIDFVKSIGADMAIDYKSQKFEEMIHGFDAVFDTVGEETTDKSFRVLKKNGILVSMLGEPNQKQAQDYGVTAIGQNTKTTSPKLNRLKELVETGAIKPHIDKVFPFERIRQAFKHLEKNHPRGKVVLALLGYS
jgi:NADPH:quinone reductase-like Zn-dependent oxidoreductase